MREAVSGRGVFHDGQTAAEHSVEVALSGDGLSLRISGETLGAALLWPLPDLRAVSEPGQATPLILTRHAESGDESPRDPARLVLTDPALIDWLRRTRPALYRRDLRHGTGRRILKRAALALAALAVMLLFILPRMADTLAGLIPVEREVAFGKTVVAQMERFLGGDRLGALHCSDPAGEAALAAMIERLTAGRDLDYEIAATVFDHPMVNAFAAPGGQVVLMRGFLDKAGSADAAAAVLAHEIGHVVSRDATRHSLRAAGSAGLLSMVLGDVAGGVLLVALGEQMLNSSYSREAEREADRFALGMLDAAGGSTGGMAAFFEMLDEGAGGDLPDYLSSHPVTAERAEAARAHAAGQGTTSPVLDEGQWQALLGICGGRG